MKKKSNTAAIATVIPDSPAILVRVELDPLVVETDIARIRGELATLVDITIDNDEDAQEANNYLRSRLQERDALESIRKAAVAPLNQEHDRIQAMFKPALQLYAEIGSRIKKALGDFALAQQAEQRRLLAEVAAVAQEPTPDALTEALARVDDAAPTKLQGTTVRAVWKVKRVVEDLLPRSFMMPDMQKIERLARECAPDTTPIIPGVVFELESIVSVRR